MRRAPLAAAVILLPAAALATATAGSGQVLDVDNYSATYGTSYINAYQCGLATPAQNMKLEWTVASSSTTGTYQIIASDTAPGTDGNCKADAPNANPAVHTQVVTTVNVSATTQDLDTVSGTALANAASVACTAENQAVYVCVKQVDNGGNEIAHANGKFLIQVQAPGKPTITSVGSGDGELIVSYSGTADHYYAVATDPNGTKYWSSSATGTSATISGLTNYVTYSVVVYAYSIGGNASLASDPVSGVPMPAADFWQVYKDAGGQEVGGCGSGAAGPQALLGALALLAVRRRAR